MIIFPIIFIYKRVRREATDENKKFKETKHLYFVNT